MSYVQAIAAVEKTGGTLVTRQDAENIVRYLSRNQEQSSAAESRPHRRRGAQIQVEPALLSLVCSGLNAERLAEKRRAHRRAVLRRGLRRPAGKLA